MNQRDVWRLVAGCHSREINDPVDQRQLFNQAAPRGLSSGLRILLLSSRTRRLSITACGMQIITRTKTGAKIDHHDLVKNMRGGHQSNINPAISPAIKFRSGIPDLFRKATLPQFGHLTGASRHFKWPAKKPRDVFVAMRAYCHEAWPPIIEWVGKNLKISQTLAPTGLSSRLCPTSRARA